MVQLFPEIMVFQFSGAVLEIKEYFPGKSDMAFVVCVNLVNCYFKIWVALLYQFSLNQPIMEGHIALSSDVGMQGDQHLCQRRELPS